MLEPRDRPRRLHLYRPTPKPEISTNSERIGYQPRPRAKARKPRRRTVDFRAQLDRQRELTRAARRVSDT